MSRSYRKINISGRTTAESEKQDKRIANRVHRRIVRERLSKEDDSPLPVLDEAYNIGKFD